MPLNCVTVRLTGGLGNQMFQYAAGRALALRLQATLWLDTRDYSSYFRPFSLTHYNLEVRHCPEEQARLRSGRPEGFWRKRWRKLQGRPFIPPAGCILERSAFRYTPEILSKSGDLYLDGCWQHEGYFASIRPLLLEEFTLREPLSAQALAYARQMEESGCPVAVHVRLGDYRNNSRARDFHGLCGAGYYRKAMETMAQLVERPAFFLFSDEPEVARDLLPPQFPVTVVALSGESAMHEELALLRGCHHQIISNSSYSWWGAWLNDYPGKVVCAPAQWLADPQAQTDIVPAAWRKIDSHLAGNS